MRNVILYLLIIVLPSCASIEGLRDKSLTTINNCKAMAGTIAVLPIKESAEYPGLSDKFEDALAKSLSTRVPSLNVINVQAFKSLIIGANQSRDFGQWLSSYESSKIAIANDIKEFAKSTSADYFLFVHSIRLSRENMRAVDTGYSGRVSNAYNVWRTNLKAIAEVMDAKSGSIVWKGMGYAENINSPRRDIDLGIIIVNNKNSEVDEYLDSMIQSAANGIAINISKCNGKILPPPSPQTVTRDAPSKPKPPPKNPEIIEVP